MSIEKDLEAFRDLVLERQIIIQSSANSSVELNGAVYRDLEPILEEIIGESPVLVSGSIYRTYRQENCFEVDPEKMVTSAYGTSQGLLVADRSIIMPPENTTRGTIIGFLIDSLDDENQGEYFFAPAENSYISSEKEIFDSVITPSDDDEVAEYLEMCLLNEEINFTSLGLLFEYIGDNPLQIDYYLSYINQIMNLNDYSLTFTSDYLAQQTDDKTYENLIKPDTQYMTTCNPDKFLYIQAAGGLCFSFKNEEYIGRFIVPINSLKSGSFQFK